MKYPELNNHCYNLQLEGEIWKPIKGWEGLYSVSNLGRVRRESWDIPSYQNIKVLKGCPADGRYPKVTLSDKVRGGKSKIKAIHRLVGEAFVPNPEGKPQIHHKNADVFDARADNLEWTTQSENIKYAFDSGRKKMTQGEECSWTKYSESLILQVYKEILKEEKSQKEIASLYGIPASTVSALKNKKTWKEVTDRVDKEYNE